MAEGQKSNVYQTHLDSGYNELEKKKKENP